MVNVLSVIVLMVGYSWPVSALCIWQGYRMPVTALCKWLGYRALRWFTIASFCIVQMAGVRAQCRKAHD